MLSIDIYSGLGEQHLPSFIHSDWQRDRLG